MWTKKKDGAGAGLNVELPGRWAVSLAPHPTDVGLVIVSANSWRHLSAFFAATAGDSDSAWDTSVGAAATMRAADVPAALARVAAKGLASTRPRAAVV